MMQHRYSAEELAEERYYWSFGWMTEYDWNYDTEENLYYEWCKEEDQIDSAITNYWEMIDETNQQTFDELVHEDNFWFGVQNEHVKKSHCSGINDWCKDDNDDNLTNNPYYQCFVSSPTETSRNLTNYYANDNPNDVDDDCI